MPQKKSALSLKQICLQKISDKLELICYGAERTDPTLRTFLETGLYQNIHFSTLPLSWLPPSLLHSLLSMTAMCRPCPHHVLHLLIQPHLTTCKISQNMNTRTSLKLLALRCKHLTCLEIPNVKVFLPAVLVTFHQLFILFRAHQLLN